MRPEEIRRPEKVKRWQIEVGRRLAMTRVALGRKDAELARFLGISQQRWHNYVTGTRPLDPELAIALCERFGITMDWLYRGNPAGLPFELAQRLGPIGLGEHPLKN